MIIWHDDKYEFSKKEQRKEVNNMFDFTSAFDGMFKPVARGCCKLAMNGNIAVKTSNGYKTYDIKKNRLTNCSNFAFDADGAFWTVPTFKVEPGDIILVNGKPECVISVGDTIKAFDYENSTINEVVPEHHVFMGKTYCYAKIFSPFVNMSKGDNMNSMMTAMMMSQMFNSNGNNNGINPMMFMMMNNGSDNPFANMFEGAFNFGSTEEKEEE